MQEQILNGFEKKASLNVENYERYRHQLPQELLDVWKDYGYGTLLDGNLKIVNPDAYRNILDRSYFRAAVSIPIMVTGFGDIITWEKNEYVGIVKYKNGTFEIMLKKMKHFFRCLSEKYFIEKFFEQTRYNEAVQRYGELEYDECFGYVPLLGLGGSEKVENLQKVKTREHIEIITQLVGKIGM